MIRRFTSVPNPVESSQVRRAFAWRDEVVGGQRIVEVRAGHLQDRRAHAAQRRDGLLESGQDTRLVALTAEFLYHRDPYSGEVGPGPLACCRGDGRHALWDRGRIA